jgi:hypothetical protein
VAARLFDSLEELATIAANPTTLDQLRTSLSSHRTAARFVPGLNQVLDVLERHLVDQETRLQALEAALTGDQRKRAALERDLVRVVEIAKREGML